MLLGLLEQSLKSTYLVGKRGIILVMQPQLNILLIEDNEEHAKIISRYVRQAERTSVTLVREERLDTGLKTLSGSHFDVILLDLRLPDSDIDTTLAFTLRASPDVPIVVLSSLEDRDLAIKAVHDGAQDYLCKTTLSSELLIRAIHSAMERKRGEARIRAEANQKSALFELGQFALNAHETSALTAMALELIAKTLSIDLANILELSADRKSLLLKFGYGWKPGYVGHTRVSADLESFSGYTVLSSRPAIAGDLKSHPAIIVSDLHAENRFRGASYLQESGAVNGMSVIIHGKDEEHPYGVLACFTKNHRIFNAEEGKFLQAVANTLAAAIQRYQLEEELGIRIKELDVAHRRKDEFLATLSHELRTPLNVVVGNLELLKTTDSHSPEFMEIVSAIERNTRLEVQLVADVLDVSRVINGKMMLNVSDFDFDQVIDSAIESVKFSAQAKEILVIKNIADEVKYFVGDENRIRQVIWNLLANAVKFTPSRGTVTIDVRRRENKIEFSVSDTGKGIAQESFSHVFERFWQEDAGINRRYMGLGLGLAIVRHIVELHGGVVNVKSEGLDKGATFTIELPIVPLETVQKNRESVTAIASLVTPVKPIEKLAFSGVQILIIDDSIDSLMLLSRLLKRLGAEVKACSTPAEGLAEAKSGRFDIIISDIGMPEMDGYELMKCLRSWATENHLPKVPAIALTAHVEESDIVRALEAGYQLHVPKPVVVKDLEVSIKRLLPSLARGRGSN